LGQQQRPRLDAAPANQTALPPHLLAKPPAVSQLWPENLGTQTWVPPEALYGSEGRWFVDAAGVASLAA